MTANRRIASEMTETKSARSPHVGIVFETWDGGDIRIIVQQFAHRADTRLDLRLDDAVELCRQLARTIDAARSAATQMSRPD